MRTFNKQEQVLSDISKEKVGQLFTCLFDNPEFKQHQYQEVSTYKYKGFHMRDPNNRMLIENTDDFEVPGHMQVWQDHENFLVWVGTFCNLNG